MLNTTRGAPGNFVLSGPRLIGKTSVLLNVRDQLHSDARRHGMPRLLVGYSSLGTVRSQSDVIRAAVAAFRHRNNSRNIFASAGGLPRLKEISLPVAKFEISSKVESPEDLCEWIAAALVPAGDPSLAGTEGVALFLDDAHVAAQFVDLGGIVKSMLECIQSLGGRSFALGLAGDQSLFRALGTARGQFDEIELDRMSHQDILALFRRALTRTQSDHAVPYGTSDLALWLLTALSGGLPHVAQRLGDAAVDSCLEREETQASQSRLLDERDVIVGAFRRDGAIAHIVKCYHDDDLQTLTATQRAILYAVAADRVRTEEVAAFLECPDALVDCELKSLATRGLIVADDKAGYRPKTYALKLWALSFTDQQSTPASPISAEIADRYEPIVNDLLKNCSIANLLETKQLDHATAVSLLWEGVRERLRQVSNGTAHAFEHREIVDVWLAVRIVFERLNLVLGTPI